MNRTIMIQGTTSSAGKSLLTTALCRIFLRDGYSVAPFKAQNMSLNSFITDEGLEMGRAQVVQAEASNIKPKVCMNPILLKPTSDKKSQIIVEGKVVDNLDASDYYAFKDKLREVVVRNYDALKADYDIVVIEGAGSPAEINLKDNDIVNMGMARIADCPVVIVADIDRGGVFASIVGTYALLDADEKARVKGFIINKFRGDIGLLKPGIEMLKRYVDKPVLGVIPYLDINIEDEDSLTDRFKGKAGGASFKIYVIKLPHMSNFTDMNVFRLFDGVEVIFTASPEDIVDPSMVVIPGTKNTIADLLFLRERCLDEKIISLHQAGRMIAGICGGFQMLGRTVEDPFSVESDAGSIEGLGLLDMKTVLLKDKTTRQTEVVIKKSDGNFKNLGGMKISGYEIHMGNSTYNAGESCFINSQNKDAGLIDGNILGTYIHGFFDNVEFTSRFLKNIGWSQSVAHNATNEDYAEFKQKEYDRLADAVRRNIDMKMIYGILNKEV
jgi:adenosylcobyric acid synthase